MNLKKLKKFLKNNESNVSMVIGVLVILLVGLFIIKNYNQESQGEIIPAIGTEENDEPEYYNVKKGDDLWKISETLLGTGYDWMTIAKLNNLEPPYRLEVDQKLIIPSTSKITPDTVTSDVPTAILTPIDQTNNTEILVNNPIDSDSLSNNEKITGDTYQVTKGDNLWNIALRAYGDGYKWTDIAKANNLSNPNIIHTGNTFVIPR